MVQKHALAAWEGGPDLRERVMADSEITGTVPADVLASAFTMDRHTEHVDFIFNRTFKE
ncbi:MAG: hypothetical protein R3A13_03720 [Bdellovibrionota bacterium]